MPRPETRYAWNGDVRIAYQLVDADCGEGAPDLIVVPGLVSHLDLVWKSADHARFCNALARFSRLILFDKRGTGLSDRDKGLPSLEDRICDLTAVLDAADARRPAMLGISEGGMMSLLFAATHPERLSALALYGAFARSPTRAWPEDQVAARLDLVERSWGAQLMPPSVAPSKAADPEFRRNWTRFEQESATPAAARELLRLSRDADVGPVLSRIDRPVLVLHRSDDRRVGVEHGRDLAARIPGARYVELPGEDHLPHVGDSDRVVAEIAMFLAGVPGATAAFEERANDRGRRRPDDDPTGRSANGLGHRPS